MPALLTQMEMLPLDIPQSDTLLLARAIDAGMALAESENKRRENDKPHIIKTGPSK